MILSLLFERQNVYQSKRNKPILEKNLRNTKDTNHTQKDKNKTGTK